MPVSSPSLLVRQVCALLDEDPAAAVVVFMPRQQLGTALKHGVVRARGHAAGLSVTTLSAYAAELTRLELEASGKRELTAGARFFLVAEILQDLSTEHADALIGNQSAAGLISPLSRTIQTLRSHGIDPDAYQRSVAGSRRQDSVCAAYRRFENRRRERDFYDSASVFTRATALVRENQIDLSATKWALLNTVALPDVKCNFVRALQDTSPSDPAVSVLTPSPIPGTEDDVPNTLPPSPLVEAELPDAPTPSATSLGNGIGSSVLFAGEGLHPNSAENIRFWTATGTRRETEAVFEDILDRGRPLDNVEIAYTSPSPYLPLIDMMAERHEIPVSLSGGRSVDATRPGQMLRRFFEWVADGGPMQGLIKMLRAGLIQFEVSASKAGESEEALTGRDAATLLAQKRYSDEPRSYPETLSVWIEGIDDDLNDLDDLAGAWVDDRRTDLRAKKNRLEVLRHVVKRLLSLGHLTDHNRLYIKDFASSAETLLEEFGPTPKPTGDPDEHTPDEAARNRLIERLNALQEIDSDGMYRAQTAASFMNKWLDLSPYVRAQRPQPGRAHVVPLESAGVADREHLYVVGLDATSTSSALPDDPFLGEDDRNALSGLSGTLPTREDRVDLQDWHTRQALDRHEGTLTLSASTYDLREDEDLFEAPLFLQLHDSAKEALNAENSLAEHHSLAPEANKVLGDLNCWTNRTPPSQSHLEEALSGKFPWLVDGLEARAARSSEDYTEYDGLLQGDSFSDLDPLSSSRPVSAGRLETYARSPFTYFLRYVLDVTPLEEPALDDVAWLDAKGRGGLLHETFRRFMSTLDRRPTAEDQPLLRDIFDKCLEDQRTRQPPPSEVVYATTRRQLWNDALLFLQVEAAEDENTTPLKFEVGFGFPPHRRKNDDYPEAPTLDLGSQSVALRGRVDRVDQRADGEWQIWDYKTGSSRSYDDTDLLDGGQHLQWALYAYALEELEPKTVRSAGYFFTNTDEMGKRIAANPNVYRTSVSRILDSISAAATDGSFPMVDADDLRYSFDKLFHDYGRRRKELNAKSWPDDRAAPPPLRDD